MVDLSKVRENLYLYKVTQVGNATVIAEKKMVAIAAFLVLAVFLAFLSFVLATGLYKVFPGGAFKASSALCIVILVVIGILGLLYRNELHLDFDNKYYQFIKGFPWKMKRYQGLFSDIVAVKVIVEHYVKERSYYFKVVVDFKNDHNFVMFSRSEEKATDAGRTLAELLGCKVIFERYEK